MPHHRGLIPDGFSPLPHRPAAASPPARPCGPEELAALINAARSVKPAPVSAVVGTASDAVSRANGELLATAWADGGGTVLTTVHWPETAASWLRPSRRFAAPEPDVWLVAATVPGWAAMGRRLVTSTGWSPARTFVTSPLADPELIALGGIGTFDGLRGAYPDGRLWTVQGLVSVHDG
ncbi:hypothetical protein OG943_26200 [Amycolatopsis sp. NBC_00345]|uniref:hypothetical protein n=1 Tax=Amycolatopsis sp. NBC_00345 TaxID=2975955 RepID=UPI002E268337